jgi:hypothetical protein
VHRCWSAMLLLLAPRRSPPLGWFRSVLLTNIVHMVQLSSPM